MTPVYFILRITKESQDLTSFPRSTRMTDNNKPSGNDRPHNAILHMQAMLFHHETICHVPHRNERGPVATEVTVALVVGEDDDDVGFAARLCNSVGRCLGCVRRIQSQDT